MYLLDTNIWLERLLEQARAAEVREFLDRIPADECIITDFTLHSIGVICQRLRRLDAFLDFVQDLLHDHALILFSLASEDLPRVVEAIKTDNLDFDDAYQYVAAEVCDATLLSFDSDFKRTDRGSQSPSDVLRSLASRQTEHLEHDDRP